MTDKYKAILLIGPPGIGKGTQGKLIGKMEGYFHFSTGEMFRELDPTTDVGAEVKRCIDERKLIQDDLTMRLFDETIERCIREDRYDPEGDHLVLDGIPRNVNQVPPINERADVKQIFHFYSPDDHLLMERIRRRARIEGRSDDKISEIIQRGFEVYRTQTLPMLEQYDPALIVKIDGSGTIDEVYQAVLQRLIR